MERKTRRVGVVATGDEIINGDIFNTNGQYVSHKLIDNGIQPGNQIIVGDTTSDIAHAIKQLLQDHDAVITIGGLGPTSDDKTRFGLADALQLELEFNPDCWQWIVDLLTSKQLAIPENNRQQAMLPKGGIPLENHNGTAAACYVNYHGQDVFMLPGPPNEFIPLFDKQVLPRLKQNHYSAKTYRRSWLLYGASEGKIAASLDQALSHHPDCSLGYRVSYPYLEIKLKSNTLETLEQASQIILPLMEEKLVSNSQQTASQRLIENLTENSIKMHIINQATGGALQHKIRTPATYHTVNFSEKASANHMDFRVLIEGLDDYWQAKPNLQQLPLHIHIQHHEKTLTKNHQIAFRGPQTITNAVEYICWTILNAIM